MERRPAEEEENPCDQERCPDHLEDWCDEYERFGGAGRGRLSAGRGVTHGRRRVRVDMLDLSFPSSLNHPPRRIHLPAGRGLGVGPRLGESYLDATGGRVL